MIYDCFMFFNEFDLLEVRLRNLAPFVDRFVLVEGDKTHSGKKKPFLFFDQIHRNSRWDDWKHKLTLVQATLPEYVGNRHALDNAQRNAIIHGLRGISPHDFVFIGDLDEIPRMETWNGAEGVFRGEAYFYRVNMRHRELWNGTVAVRAGRFASPFSSVTPQDCRNFRDLTVPCGEGKHFSWLEDPMVKVKSFAHAELDTPDFNPDMAVHPGDKTPLQKVSLDTGWWPKGIKRKEWIA